MQFKKLLQMELKADSSYSIDTMNYGEARRQEKYIYNSKNWKQNFVDLVWYRTTPRVLEGLV